MRIREFMGADFEPLARMVGEEWHKEHGERAYWQGADELCAYLARADKGFVAHGETDDGEAGPAVLGVILVASPLEEDHNSQLRMHWLQQRTIIASMANALGINARAEAALIHEEHELCERVGEQRGGECVGEVVLIIVSKQARGAGVGRALFVEGIGWLAEHGVQRVRLVTDDDCSWQVYEHLDMQRVLEAKSETCDGLGMRVYEAEASALLRRLGV